MSQTPTQTPSRRRAPVDTPGSVRSNTSTSDRSVLLERTEELELEIEELRRAVGAERERRRGSTQRQLEKQRATDASRDEVRTTLLEKLRQMDDDALTALLGASVHSLARAIAGADSAWTAVDAGLVPSKSVGVEGTGSGSDIDRRLAVSARGVQRELQQSRHAASVNTWLNDRQRRSNALVQSLAQFSYLDIDTLDQESDERRRVHLVGSFARLFPIDIQFDIDDSGASPAIQRLAIDIPGWLSSTLNIQHALFSRLVKRNDLPAVLLMLRTMIPLLSLRRNVFTSLMESYTDLVRAHIRAWESKHGLDFAPWYPPGTSRKRASTRVDESLGQSLIATDAETLVLQNSQGASLTLRFRIVWNRYGHAVPQLDAEPNVPGALMDSTAKAFLHQFGDEFKHLCKVAIQQDGIVGWGDEEQDQAVGRWGLMPALHATIAAFFRLATDDASDTASD